MIGTELHTFRAVALAKPGTGSEGVKRVKVKSSKRESAALVGPTAADCRDTMVEGKSGILATASPWCRPAYEPSKRKLSWPNGADRPHLFQSEEADRLRGPQFDFAWADELSGLESGAASDLGHAAFCAPPWASHPRWMVTTTPRPIKLLKELLAREGTDVVVRRGAHSTTPQTLAAPFLEAIRARYEGTRLGRQELNAEILDRRARCSVDARYA